MSEPETTTDPVVKVARDLTEIEKLALVLEVQAIQRGNDRLMPGGRAMVVLAPEANLQAWSALLDQAERWHFDNCPLPHHRKCRYVEHVSDEDDQDNEDPMRTLLFWSEAWRTERGYPLGDRTATLLTEASFIRNCLEWAWDNEIHWDDFVRDINQARRRLEDVLHAGRRAERSRVRCDNPGCERHPLLIRVYRTLARDDYWKCTSCKHKYDRDAFRRTYARQLRSELADRYILMRDAVAVLREQGRPERTIRKWFEPPDLSDDGDPESVVVGYCEVGTRRVYVWWPDLWQRHLSTTRRRSA